MSLLDQETPLDGNESNSNWKDTALGSCRIFLQSYSEINPEDREDVDYLTLIKMRMKFQKKNNRDLKYFELNT